MKKDVDRLIRSFKENKSTHITALKIIISAIFTAAIIMTLVVMFPKAMFFVMLGIVITFILALVYSLIYDSVRIRKRITNGR